MFEDNGKKSGTFALNCGGALGLLIGVAVALFVGVYFWMPYIEEQFGKPKKLGAVLLLPLFLIPLVTGRAGYGLWQWMFPARPRAPCRPCSNKKDSNRFRGRYGDRDRDGGFAIPYSDRCSCRLYAA